MDTWFPHEQRGIRFLYRWDLFFNFSWCEPTLISVTAPYGPVPLHSVSIYSYVPTDTLVRPPLFSPNFGGQGTSETITTVRRSVVWENINLCPLCLPFVTAALISLQLNVSQGLFMLEHLTRTIQINTAYYSFDHGKYLSYTCHTFISHYRVRD